MGFKEYLKSQEGEKVDNVTRGLIALGSFAFLSMLFPLMIGILLKEPKKKYKKSCLSLSEVIYK